MSNKFSISPDVRVVIVLINWCTSHTWLPVLTDHNAIYLDHLAESHGGEGLLWTAQSYTLPLSWGCSLYRTGKNGSGMLLHSHKPRRPPIPSIIPIGLCQLIAGRIVYWHLRAKAEDCTQKNSSKALDYHWWGTSNLPLSVPPHNLLAWVEWARTPIHLHKLAMLLIIVSGPGGSAALATVVSTDSWSCCLKDRARLSSQRARYCDRKR